MKHVLRYIVIWGLLIGFAGCRQASTSRESIASPAWLIPPEEILDGGPGKDGIPALSNPRVIPPSLASFVRDEDLVLGTMIGGLPRAYPHAILDWHEIVNDVVGETAISVTYCPLTGSGMVWDGGRDRKRGTFGISGLLYNSNLIAYDRETGSYWSQMRFECVNGPLIGQKAETRRVIETTWKTWKELYPHTTVLSSNTGHARPYGKYPYGDYRESDRLIFPVSNDDKRLHRKERVLGVIVGTRAKVYPLKQFSGDLEIVHEMFNGVPLVIVGSRERRFAVCYEARVGDTVLTFSRTREKSPGVMKDQDGTVWDIFGRALEGPREGEELIATRSFVAYWFAWAAFYPGTEIHTR